MSRRYQSSGLWGRCQYRVDTAWILGLGRVRVRRAARGGRVGGGGSDRVEQYSRRSGDIVGNHRVVDEAHSQSILERDSATIPAGHVVRDDVVGDRYGVPVARISGIEGNLGAVYALEPNAAAAAALGGVAHDQVRIDHQAGPGAVRQLRRTIHVGYRSLANRSIRRRTRNQNP